MAEKNFNNVRIVNKHDTEANWLKATRFTPKQGELIVYDIDDNYSYERIKIGDGVQNVNDLPFVDADVQEKLKAKASSTNPSILGVISTSNNFDNGYSEIFKNNSADADYGTRIRDYNADGDQVSLTVSAELDSVYVTGGKYGVNSPVITVVDVDSSLSTSSTNPVQNKVVSTVINNLNTLVGDTSVSEQINNALDSYEVSWNNLKDKPFYEETNTTYTVVHEESFTAQSNGKYFAPSDLGMWSGTYRITLNDEVFDNVSPAGMLYFEFGNYTYKASVVDGGEYVLSGLTPNASYNIKVEEISEETTLVQIDEKFIPDSLKPKSTKITLTASGWTGSSNPWSQVVTVKGVTANSKVDLQPTAVQIVELQNNDISLMTENNNGVITAYALGNKPTVNYTMQVLITEVTPI